jgi:hypothetical protein
MYSRLDPPDFPEERGTTEIKVEVVFGRTMRDEDVGLWWNSVLPRRKIWLVLESTGMLGSGFECEAGSLRKIRATALRNVGRAKEVELSSFELQCHSLVFEVM